MDRTFRVKPTENQRKSNRISERIRLLLKHNIRPTNSLAFASNKSHAHKHRIPSAERTRAALCIALYFRIRGSVERVNARTPPVASFLSSFATRESSFREKEGEEEEDEDRKLESQEQRRGEARIVGEKE